MRLGFAVLLVALCFAGKADAAVVMPGTGSPLVSERAVVSLKIARAWWGRELPCQVKLYEASNAALLAAAPAFVPAPGRMILEVTREVQSGPVCPIWTNVRARAASIRNRVMTCSVTVHDVGHILGFGHDTRPRSVMNAVVPVVYACWRRFVPRARRAWWRATYGVPVWARRP